MNDRIVKSLNDFCFSLQETTHSIYLISYDPSTLLTHESASNFQVLNFDDASEATKTRSPESRHWTQL